MCAWMDRVPVVKKETAGRKGKGKTTGQDQGSQVGLRIYADGVDQKVDR